MNKTKRGYRISNEVREQILKRVKDEGIPVTQAAEEHGVSTYTIYKWLAKGASGHPSWSEVDPKVVMGKDFSAISGLYANVDAEVKRLGLVPQQEGGASCGT